MRGCKLRGTDIILLTAVLPSASNAVRLIKASHYMLVEYTNESPNEGISQSLGGGWSGKAS